ncbi:hypothetical protein TPA0598_17_00080 [Streptomyces lydicamycinicus]|uniref:Uncharacterized protein n=1 Tax=Streptomyces lydicamycinicus TaxID=1546107 RepID=A0A0N7YN00_9ACTN|nr:hypothetical protein [Streptomyces lydicamycinicus]GAO13027.1 hypothetical protein TPA0598_17_00080 [Streptomyces lydicamycinicus]
MTQIPEEVQARALRAVSDAAKKRDKIIEEAQRPVAEAAVAAVRAGASRTRIREEAGVSPRVLYGWLTAAGIPVRKKKPKAG